MERSRFDQAGWVGSYALISPDGVRRLTALRDMVLPRITLPDEMARSEDPQAFARRPWFKSMHVLVPEYYDVASHPDIVGRVASVLGPDLIAWGLTLTRSVPGGVHRWHVDIEHMHWAGVSVYIGLQNNDLASTLKVLEGSQHMGVRPQALDVKDDASALAAVRNKRRDATILRVPVRPGEFFLFHGQLWHASHNTGDKLRVAMIIHYSRPDAPVRIPLNFDDPIHWHPSQPPCVLVSGEDRYGVNRLVGRPGPLPST
jgi:ectoine hydroxylase-related dioxygenase (phytanoyl-CoA dioxygenase family)